MILVVRSKHDTQLQDRSEHARCHGWAATPTESVRRVNGWISPTTWGKDYDQGRRVKDWACQRREDRIHGLSKEVVNKLSCYALWMMVHIRGRRTQWEIKRGNHGGCQQVCASAVWEGSTFSFNQSVAGEHARLDGVLANSGDFFFFFLCH